MPNERTIQAWFWLRFFIHICFSIVYTGALHRDCQVPLIGVIFPVATSPNHAYAFKLEFTLLFRSNIGRTTPVLIFVSVCDH